LWLDIKILFRTVLVVLKQDGIAFTQTDDVINAKESATTLEKELATKP